MNPGYEGVPWDKFDLKSILISKLINKYGKIQTVG